MSPGWSITGAWSDDVTVSWVITESLAPNWSLACQRMNQIPAVPGWRLPLRVAEGLIPVGVFVVNESPGGEPVALIVMIEFGSPLPAVAVIETKVPSITSTDSGALMEIALTAVARAAGRAEGWTETRPCAALPFTRYGSDALPRASDGAWAAM